MKKNFLKVLVILLFATGLGIMLYPAISKYLMSKNQTTAIQNYKYTVEKMEKEETEKLLQEARKYNKNYSNLSIIDAFSSEAYRSIDDNYKEILNINGIMGYVEIPKISVKLPIYHGTSEEVLKKGVGHLETTPLPVGGIGNHSVISGHRGLAESRLFTDLDKLEVNDEINIYILSERLKYKVDQIKIVEPYNTVDLQADKIKDYITLVTCTPYAINTHRLLVRAERFEEFDENLINDGNINEEEGKTVEIIKRNNHINYTDTKYVVIIVVIITIFFVTINTSKKTKK